MNASGAVRRRSGGGGRVLPALALGAFGCTDAYVYDPDEGHVGAVDRAVSVRGRFCTEKVNDVIRPIKILLAMDTSQSMAVTDPNGTRATALVNLLDGLPDEPEVYLGVMVFAGNVAWITNGGRSGFQQLVTMTPTDRIQLAQTLLSYAYAGGVGTGPNRDATDFVKPLDEIYATISRDVSDTRTQSLASGTPVRPRYHVIFLSDGHPRSDQDDEIWPRCRAIRSLRFEAADVRLNTVHVFLPDIPVNPSCTAGGCQILVVESDAARLRRMAEDGGGEFRSFRNGEPINFLTFRFGALKRAFLIKETVVYNLNARPGSPLARPDSDADGLSDEEERTLALGGVASPTDPRRRDTDGDGFSDGIEVYFQARNLPFQPSPQPNGSNINKGCAALDIGVDREKDGLLDCDEQLLGTLPKAYDTDNDGLPDVLEWLASPVGDATKAIGTQAATPDADDDPDRDGLKNAVEVRMHTDPATEDLADLSTIAARYQIVLEPQQNPDGQQCYQFRVDNVLLVPTIDVGRGPGENRIVVSFAQVAADELFAPPIYRVAEYTARYPVSGIKDPPDGVIVVQPSDFRRP